MAPNYTIFDCDDLDGDEVMQLRSDVMALGGFGQVPYSEFMDANGRLLSNRAICRKYKLALTPKEKKDLSILENQVGETVLPRHSGTALVSLGVISVLAVCLWPTATPALKAWFGPISKQIADYWVSEADVVTGMPRISMSANAEISPEYDIHQRLPTLEMGEESNMAWAVAGGRKVISGLVNGVGDTGYSMARLAERKAKRLVDDIGDTGYSMARLAERKAKRLVDDIGDTGYKQLGYGAKEALKDRAYATYKAAELGASAAMVAITANPGLILAGLAATVAVGTIAAYVYNDSKSRKTIAYILEHPDAFVEGMEAAKEGAMVREDEIARPCPKHATFAELCAEDRETLKEELLDVGRESLPDFRKRVIELSGGNRWFKIFRKKSILSWHFFHADGAERTRLEICRALCHV